MGSRLGCEPSTSQLGGRGTTQWIRHPAFMTGAVVARTPIRHRVQCPCTGGYAPRAVNLRTGERLRGSGSPAPFGMPFQSRPGLARMWSSGSAIGHPRCRSGRRGGSSRSGNRTGRRPDRRGDARSRLQGATPVHRAAAFAWAGGVIATVWPPSADWRPDNQFLSEEVRETGGLTLIGPWLFIAGIFRRKRAMSR